MVQIKHREEDGTDHEQADKSQREVLRFREMPRTVEVAPDSHPGAEEAVRPVAKITRRTGIDEDSQCCRGETVDEPAQGIDIHASVRGFGDSRRALAFGLRTVPGFSATTM